MLVLLVPRSPLHRLCVNEGSDVVGADPRRATWTSLFHFGDLLYGFRDGVQLRGACVGIAAAPFARLYRCRQALQRHADWTRTLPGSLGAQLDLRCRAAIACTTERSPPVSAGRHLQSVEPVHVRDLCPDCSRLDLLNLVQSACGRDNRRMPFVHFGSLKDIKKQQTFVKYY